MVCLITPPSPFLLDERVFLSLGILRVAASLEAAGVAIEHLDLSGVTNYEDAIRDYLRVDGDHAADAGGDPDQPDFAGGG
jgi:hypothetical protein